MILNLRDRFAIQAMEHFLGEYFGPRFQGNAKAAAFEAYELADAMMEARGEPEPSVPPIVGTDQSAYRTEGK